MPSGQRRLVDAPACRAPRARAGTAHREPLDRGRRPEVQRRARRRGSARSRLISTLSRPSQRSTVERAAGETASVAAEQRARSAATRREPQPRAAPAPLSAARAAAARSARCTAVGEVRRRRPVDVELAQRAARGRSRRHLPAQPLERARGARLHGARLDAERGGGLGLGELEQVAAAEHEPVVVAQPRQRAEQRRARLAPRARSPRPSRRRAAAATPQRQRAAPPGRAAPVARLVGDDRQQPRPQRLAARGSAAARATPSRTRPGRPLRPRRRPG